MLKVRIHQFPGSGDKLHRRHFLQAMCQAESAEVKPDDGNERDFTFAFVRHKPVTGKSIIYFAHDPHALVADMDANEMLDPQLKELAHSMGIPQSFYEEEKIKFKQYTTILPFIDSFDIYSPMISDPLDTILSPKLKHAQSMIIPRVVPEWIFNLPATENRPDDVFFMGACGKAYYPLRALAVTRLQHLHKKGKLKAHLPPYALPSCAELGETWTEEEFDRHQYIYASYLQRAKISVFDGSVYNYSLSRHHECMACGCLVLAPLPRDAEYLGFQDNVNMVAITPENWERKLWYFLKNEKERRRITRNASELMDKYHTCEARTKIVLKQLTDLKAGATFKEVAWSA